MWAAQGYSEMGKHGGGATEGTESIDDLKEEACSCFACAALSGAKVLQCTISLMHGCRAGCSEEERVPNQRSCNLARPGLAPFFNVK